MSLPVYELEYVPPEESAMRTWRLFKKREDFEDFVAKHGLSVFTRGNGLYRWTYFQGLVFAVKVAS